MDANHLSSAGAARFINAFEADIRWVLMGQQFQAGTQAE